MNWSLRQLIELLSFPFALALGQILFKRASLGVDPTQGGWLLQVARAPALWMALILYAAATVIWVRILATLPLSRAYPFMALAFVLVPAAGYFFFREPITLRFMCGTGFIIVGVLLTARG